MQTVIQHKKFTNDSMEAIEKRLKDDNEKDRSIIHYLFGCFADYPQYIVLFYTQNDKIIKEFIKVKNFGLYFHDSYHGSLKELIGWFKSNFLKDDYKKFVKKTKPPLSSNFIF
jgi:hypothetical protein